MTKRFVVYPGYVRSVNDGDWHYVGARQLMQLYHVRPSECIVISSKNTRRGIRDEDLEKLLPLRPMESHYIPVSALERRHWPAGSWKPENEHFDPGPAFMTPGFRAVLEAALADVGER